MKFVLVDKHIWNIDNIIKVDVSRIEELSVKVFPSKGQPIVVKGAPAIDLVMSIKPSVLEGKRLRWLKRAWAIHNLVGHPLMQIAAFLKQYRLAMYLHEVTVPRPRGKKRHADVPKDRLR